MYSYGLPLATSAPPVASIFTSSFNLTIVPGSIHNSPSKGGDDATFPPADKDWGDLPDPTYPTDSTDGGEGIGPSHYILVLGGSPYLGGPPDLEPDGQPMSGGVLKRPGDETCLEYMPD